MLIHNTPRSQSTRLTSWKIASKCFTYSSTLGSSPSSPLQAPHLVQVECSNRASWSDHPRDHSDFTRGYKVSLVTTHECWHSRSPPQMKSDWPKTRCL